MRGCLGVSGRFLWHNEGLCRKKVVYLRSYSKCLSDKRYMSTEQSSYRPHDSGHDYYDKGIYLVTLVTRGRDPLFGRLNDNVRMPGVELSETGRVVMEEWEKIPSFEEKKGRKVRVLASVVMPDHFHGVIEIEERMDKSLGNVIWGFKVACTKRWRKESTRPTTVVQPSLAVTEPDLHRMSKKQRAEYYAQRPKEEQPLFDDDYDDTICFPAEVDMEEHLRHRSAMLRYVDDNPRRAIIRRARPDFMRRCMHVVIDGRDYAAFGNLFLLRWARKEQVFCHRKARYSQLTKDERQRAGITYEALPETPTSIPYEKTAAYKEECGAWLAKIMAGQTVIVTPGISKGEAMMKDECLKNGFPLIHLQKESIGRYWKPEAKRFNACCRGALLILAPWQTEGEGDYAIFHNLNKLAEEICRFDGEAKIITH